MGLFGGILSGIGSLVGGGLQAAATIEGQKLANKTNIELANKANEWNIDQWNRQNEYNDPSQQMKRLQTAGLNPNLVYGSGNVSGNVVSSSPKSEVAQVRNIYEGLKLPMMLDELSKYQDVKQKEANIENTKVNTHNSLIAGRIASLKESQEQFKSLLYEDNVTADYGIKAQKWYQETGKTELLNLQRLIERQVYNDRIRQIKAESGLKENEWQFQSALKPYGITQSDPIYVRMAAKIWEEIKNRK